MQKWLYLAAERGSRREELTTQGIGMEIEALAVVADGQNYLQKIKSVQRNVEHMQ